MPHDDAVPLLLDFAAELSRVPHRIAPATTAHAAILLADQLTRVSAGTVPAGARSGTVMGESLAERAASDAARGSIADRDDVHWGVLVHPGSVVWPTVLALGERPDAVRTTGDLLRAAAIGYETMVRLAGWFRAAQALGGATSDLAPYHLTALVAPAGAAAAASALLSPDGSVSADALGHALSVAGGSSGALAERSGTRAFHRAHAVRTGIAAALAAEDGLPATQRDLERGGGALPPVSAEAVPEAKALLLRADLRALADTSVRLFPTSGWFQAAYEAARSVAGSATLDSATLGSAVRDSATLGSAVRVTVSPATAARSVSLAEADTDPWSSLETAVARGLAAGGRTGTESTLRDAVTVLTADGVEGATVEVHDGNATRSATVVRPLGHPTRPATTADLATSWGLSPAIAETWIGDLLRALETSTAIPRSPAGSAHPSSAPRRSIS